MWDIFFSTGRRGCVSPALPIKGGIIELSAISVVSALIVGGAQPLTRCARFDGFEHAHEVSTPDFANVVGGVAALQQPTGDVRRFARVLVADDARTVIEVRADSNMIDTDSLHDVVDVIEVVLESRPRYRGERLGHVIAPSRAVEPVRVIQDPAKLRR